MEHIDRTHPAETAAQKRLLYALALSLVLHAFVVTTGGIRARDNGFAEAIHPSRLPLFPALFVSLEGMAMGAASQAHMPFQTNAAVRNKGGIVVPDAHYYAVNELDVLPAPRNPDRMLGLAPSSGSVRLLVLIDASGRVTGVSIFDAETSASQAAAAASGMRRFAFVAARKHGRPVRSEVVIELAAAART